MKLKENKNVAVGYCRVSTDEQADKGLSLDYQEEQCRKASQQDGFTEITIIRDEGKSGKNLQRKGIQEVLDLAKKKEISVIYVTNSDRLARNMFAHGFLRHTLRSNGVNLKYLNGQSSADDAASILADNMFASFNQYHSDGTREKTMQATEAKARAGYFPTHAPIGYINCENPNKSCEKVAIRIIMPNPKTGMLITEAFKLYASGQYNVYELNDVMNEKGLVTNRGKKLTPSVFYNLLKNRLYLGEIHWLNIHNKKGKHEPLIDEHTFDQVQSRLSENNGNRCRRRKFFWLLNGYVFCPVHNRRYTAEWHLKKSIAYYHCPAGSDCSRYIEKSDLERQVADKFKNLQFEPKFVNSIIEKVKFIFETRRNEYYAKHRGLLNRKNAHEAKLKVAEDRLLDETLAKSDYDRIRDEIKTAIATVDVQIAKLGKEKEVNIDVVSEILGFTKDIYNVYMRSTEQLQKKFIGFFFDRFEVKNGIIIKYCYSPLFEELMRLKVLTYKNHNSKKTVENNTESNIIIRPKLGDYRELNPNRFLHREPCYRYTIITIQDRQVLLYQI